jgi:hypothetical protein
LRTRTSTAARWAGVGEASTQWVTPACCAAATRASRCDAGRSSPARPTSPAQPRHDMTRHDTTQYATARRGYQARAQGPLTPKESAGPLPMNARCRGRLKEDALDSSAMARARSAAHRPRQQGHARTHTHTLGACAARTRTHMYANTRAWAYGEKYCGVRVGCEESRGEGGASPTHPPGPTAAGRPRR